MDAIPHKLALATLRVIAIASKPVIVPDVIYNLGHLVAGSVTRIEMCRKLDLYIE